MDGSFIEAKVSIKLLLIQHLSGTRDTLDNVSGSTRNQESVTASTRTRPLKDFAS